MAASGAIRAGKAFVEVGTDNTNLTKGLRAAEQKLKGFGSSITSMGAAILGAGSAMVAPFITGLKGAMDLEDAMSASAVIFGESADIIISKSEEMASTGRAVQGDFINAANSFGAVFKGAGKSQQEAAELGNQLAELGLDMASFGSGVTQEEAFTALQAALRGEFDPLERFTVFLSAAKIESEALTSGLAKTKDEIGDYAKKQATLNLIMKQTADQQGDQLRTIDSTKGVWTVLKNTLTNMSTAIGTAVAPMVVGLGKVVVEIARKASEWVKANQGLLSTILLVGAGVAAFGAVLIGIGVSVSALGVVLGGLTTIATTVGTVISTVFGAVLSPIGLVVIAIGGIGAAFLMLTEMGQSTLAWLGSAFNQLVADATLAFNGIGDALKSGNIMLAAQILWAFLKVEFQKGINFLSSIWNDWGLAVQEVFAGVSFGIASHMIDAWASIKATFPGAITFMQESLATFFGWVMKMWNNVGGFFSKTWERIKSLFSGEDITAKLDAIDKQTAAVNAAQDQSTVSQIEEFKKGMTPEAIEADRLAQQQALKDQQKAETDARRKAADESIKAGQDSLDAAQAELAVLTGEAALVDDEAAFEESTITPKLEPDELDRSIKGIQSKVDVAGSFSASALAGLGVGSTIENEQLDEQKKAVKELEKLNKKKAVFT